MNNITIGEIAEKIAAKDNILLLSHINPDADTLGSVFALKHALKDNKRVEIACDDTVPKRLQFISEMQSKLHENGLNNFIPELIIAMDAAEISLLGKCGVRDNGYIHIKIDHHPQGKDFAEFNYIDTGAAATGEIAYELILQLQKLGIAKINSAASTALYAAISSDTGCFKYTNVTARTMRYASELIELGAEHHNVCNKLFERKTVNQVVAHRILLNNLNMYRSGSMAVVTITNEIKNENGLVDDDFGGMANYLREIDGIQLSVLIIQNTINPRKYKVSVRSDSTIYSNKICHELGGGGHDRAAGASVYADTPEDAEYQVIQAAQSLIGYV